MQIRQINPKENSLEKLNTISVKFSSLRGSLLVRDSIILGKVKNLARKYC